VVLSFSLPRGSYALSVLREVMKLGEDADETYA
jgi:tRNA(Glu) U13 pseudouridine synthase TruD